MTDDLTGGLDLLGDWLDAKGYGEEAGLCTRVMDHMHKQDARIADLQSRVMNLEDEAWLDAEQIVSLKSRISTLEVEKRAFQDIAEQFSKDKAEYYRHILRLEAALKETLEIAERNELGDYQQRARAAMGKDNNK